MIESYLDLMADMIVYKYNKVLSLLNTIHSQAATGSSIAMIDDGDVISRVAVSIVNRIGLPIFRWSRRKSELVAIKLQPQQ